VRIKEVSKYRREGKTIILVGGGGVWAIQSQAKKEGPSKPEGVALVKKNSHNPHHIQKKRNNLSSQSFPSEKKKKGG